MAIQQTTEVDEITLIGNDTVLYREVTTTTDGDKEVAPRAYHRTSFNRGEDLTKHPARVAAVCRAAWSVE